MLTAYNAHMRASVHWIMLSAVDVALKGQQIVRITAQDKRKMRAESIK